MSTHEIPLPIDPERPWPGLLAFSESAANLFHGRTKEVQELVRLLDHETVSFLYGKSGLGKTSLLQAGLFPRLRDLDRVPIYLRFSYEANALSAKAQLYEAISATMDLLKIDGARPRPNDSAWAYLHRRDFEWWSSRNRLVRPVFVFDQFEELFTLGQETAEGRTVGTSVIELLMELTTHRPSADLRREFEIRPEALEAFNYVATNYQLLFAFREDFLPQFDQLREKLRINPHNRIALERLNGVAATQSIEGTGGRLVTPHVAQEIVRFVAGDKTTAAGGKPLDLLEVEPWLLCLVCQQLNEQRLAVTPPLAQISADLLTGTRDLILAQYYASCVADFDARVPAFLEDRLLTDSGFRNTYPYHEAIRLDGISARVIDALVDRRLLRKEQHMGAQRVEISHDVLGPVLLRYRQQRLQREADAIAVIRDVSNRRRLAEGRKRSARFVVLTTAVVTSLIIVIALRAHEATHAEDMLNWGQGLQSDTYEMLLDVVKAKPVNQTILFELDRIRTSTHKLRLKYPDRTQLAAQEVQFLYLSEVAEPDSQTKKILRTRAFDLADTLVTMKIADSVDATQVETSLQVVGILAERGRQFDVLTKTLRRQVQLLDSPFLIDYNRNRSLVAARRLAERVQSTSERFSLLRMINQSGRAGLVESQFAGEELTVDSIATAEAQRYEKDTSPDTLRIRQLYGIAMGAREGRVEAAVKAFSRDTAATKKAALVQAYGNLGWAAILAGDPEASKNASLKALQMDNSKDWIVQNLLHARVFLGEFNAILPELRRLRNSEIHLNDRAVPFSIAARDDIAVFRSARLRHSDLDRYEQFFRGDSSSSATQRLFEPRR